MGFQCSRFPSALPSVIHAACLCVVLFPPTPTNEASSRARVSISGPSFSSMLTSAYRKSYFLYLPASVISLRWNLWFCSPKCVPNPLALLFLSVAFLNAILFMLMTPYRFSYQPFFSDDFLVWVPLSLLSHPILVLMEDGVLENPIRGWYKLLYLCLSILLPIADKLQNPSNNEGKDGSEFLARGARRLSSFPVIFLFLHPAPPQALYVGDTSVSETNITCIHFCPPLEEAIQFYQANLGLSLIS